MTYISTSLFWLLGVYNTLEKVWVSTSDFYNKLYIGVQYAFIEKVYYIFEFLPTPVLISSVNISAESSAVPEWYYLPDSNTFLEWEQGTPLSVLKQSEPLELPILSMEILEDDIVIFDLTNFIETMKVHTVQSEFFPSVAHILAAWSISSAVILDATREFKVRMITTKADTKEVLADNYEYILTNDPVTT